MDKKIIVIGGSAGSLDALKLLASGLSPVLPAALFVVMHIPASRKSELPDILNKSGPLRATHPQQRQRIEPGHIYVAPPDYHMVIKDSQVQLWRGPKENHHRPAINALFRSAAAEHGKRVVGIILSGVLDDGVTGLHWIKEYGGVAVVQDPNTAPFDAMPQNALKHVDVDYIVEPDELGSLLNSLAAGETTSTSTDALNEVAKERRWNQKTRNL